jgi:hypothetical protein
VSNQHRIVIYQKIFKASLASIAYWPISVPWTVSMPKQNQFWK